MGKAALTGNDTETRSTGSGTEPNLDLAETGGGREGGELETGPFLGVLKNAIGPGGAPDFIEGLTAGFLFHFLIEGAQQTGGTLDDLGLFVVEVNVEHLRGRQGEDDSTGANLDIFWPELAEIDTGSGDAVGKHQEAVLPVPFDVVEADDLFEDVFDRDQLGHGLDLGNDGGGVGEVGMSGIGREAAPVNAAQNSQQEDECGGNPCPEPDCPLHHKRKRTGSDGELDFGRDG